MRYYVVGCLLVLLAGCGKPFLVQTQNRVAFDTPMETSTRLLTDSAGLIDHGPVRPMLLEGDTKGMRLAVIDLDGLLLNSDLTGPYSVGENPVALFREKLDAAAADAQVVAVVLRINSPGGSVNAADLMRRDVQTFRARTKKPVVACLMGLATGGAYFVASAADAIVADPTTVTGAVGVILNLYNLRELMGQFNIIPQAIKAGPKIDLGTSARNLTPEEKQLLETMAEEFHQYMKQKILEARPSIDQAGGSTFDGRVFTATQALARKLIDRVGYSDEAIDMARQLLHCPQAAVAMYHRADDPARSFYAQTPNAPLQGAGILPNIPGLERNRLPTFLSIWQAEMTTERLGGK
jgi:protease IV